MKKEKEFKTLSDEEIDIKGVQDVVYQGVYFRKNIKEFIKIILEEINEEWDGKGKCPTTEEIIKKRAGEKLCQEK